MILHFPTQESASLAVARLREEGHYAEVMDAAVPGLWGPALTDGVRVLASEEFMEEGDEEIPRPPGPSGICAALDHFFRVVLQISWLLAMIIMGAVVLSVAMDEFLAFVVSLLELAVAIYLMASWSIFCHHRLSKSSLRGHAGLAESKWVMVVVVLLLVAKVIAY